jgi:hypothetical protein
MRSTVVRPEVHLPQENFFASVLSATSCCPVKRDAHHQTFFRTILRCGEK